MKFYYIFALLICHCASVLLLAQPVGKSFFLGHSLVNFHTPNMVKKLSDHAGLNFPYKANIGIGASLYWHYTYPETGEGDTWNVALPEGGYDQFLLTEALALQAYLGWNTHRYVDSLFSFSRIYNPNIKLYVYETWHCIFSGTGSGCESWEWDNDTIIPFRTRLIQDLPLWESIADSVNERHGEGTAFVIPAGQALLALNDSIDAGLVPGIDNLSQLFVDNIHTSYRGAYFIACVMYGALQQTSPEGLPNSLTDPWGSLYANYTDQSNPIPTPQQAAIFQRIAWRTVCNYAHSGVNDCNNSVGIPNINNMPDEPLAYPNPLAANILTVETSKNDRYQIFNINNKSIQEGELKGGKNTIQLHFSAKGIYFLTVGKKVKKIIVP